MYKVDIEHINSCFLELQNTVCYELAAIDGGAVFKEDIWQNKGCKGQTRVLCNGNIFEQAAVNFSRVHGHALPISATYNRPELEGKPYQALGVSIVVHPENPYIPTSHANVRFFVSQEDGKKLIWWFGGCFDLTPFYGFYEDAVHWHRTAQMLCDPFGKELYYKYKRLCDDYFFIKHRHEARGIGGIFFDDLSLPNFDQAFAFTRAVAQGYLDAYIPIVKRRKNHPYGESERQFQLYRRGRYVEFNLVWDRGTQFGLQSGGRAESILMSIPPVARWQYNYVPAADSLESLLYRDFLPIRDWLN